MRRLSLFVASVAAAAASLVLGLATAPPATAVEVDRIAGADRYETAAAVSASSFGSGVPVVYVASGESWPDAVTAGAAARGRGPVLLTSRDALPPVTILELHRLEPQRVVVLGGDGAIAPPVVMAIAEHAGAQLVRLGGADRYETAALVSADAFGAGVDVAYVAGGTGFVDALAAGAASRGAGPVLLVPPVGVPDAVAAELARLSPGRLAVVGGEHAVSTPIANALGTFAATEAVMRLAGPDRYATAMTAIGASFPLTTGDVFLASGEHFADALAAVPAATASDLPLVLVPPDGVPAAVRYTLAAREPARLRVVGGPSAIPHAQGELLAEVAQPGPTLVPAAWLCPVQGERSFVDDFGAPRSGGRSHQGIDIMAPRGTPVVANVPGVVRRSSSARGGLSYYLDGDDGNEYFGAHLDSYAGGAEGRVEAGAVIGAVGNTGDASGGAAHLHFEIHPGGGTPVNPFPIVSAHC